MALPAVTPNLWSNLKGFDRTFSSEVEILTYMSTSIG
jgi:hypothetical protein